MLNVNDFGDLSFLFVFDGADQMRDFFAEAKARECFPGRTAAYDFCANNVANDNMTILDHTGSVYVVEEKAYRKSTYTIDVSGKISSTNLFSDHRQLENSKIVLEFPKILKTIARKYPESTFYGMIHDTDFDWWETTIVYEYKDGVLKINYDGYSEDGPDSSRKAQIVIPIG